MATAQQKNNLMEKILLAEICKNPGRCKAQYCRAVNGHGDDERFCYDKNCYGNSWKRARGICKKPECYYSKPSVWRRMAKLELAGLITITREKVKDRWMSRGWDWMKVCRPGGAIQ